MDRMSPLATTVQNVNVPRRSEVLYNSNRLHRPGYAGAHWYRLPIDLQDLTFIEVVRGPSPEYGTNAMTSTVNLIQDTVATRGLYGSARVGDGATRDVFLNGGLVVRGNTAGLALLSPRKTTGSMVPLDSRVTIRTMFLPIR